MNGRSDGTPSGGSFVAPVPPPPGGGRARQPAWETVAILLAIVAIWPALLDWRMGLNLPGWLVWGALLAALGVMVWVCVRRIRRLRRMSGAEGGGAAPLAGPFPVPPGGSASRGTGVDADGSSLGSTSPGVSPGGPAPTVPPAPDGEEE